MHVLRVGMRWKQGVKACLQPAFTGFRRSADETRQKSRQRARHGPFLKHTIQNTDSEMAAIGLYFPATRAPLWFEN